MIWCEGLTRTFGEQEAVADLSLDIARGEARVADRDPMSEPFEVRKGIGYVPDELPTYREHTAREFLLFFARLNWMERTAARARAAELLERGTVGAPVPAMI